jgi:hypothetical protein
VPVFSAINQWGALPFPLHRLTPHSLSRRVRVADRAGFSAGSIGIAAACQTIGSQRLLGTGMSLRGGTFAPRPACAPRFHMTRGPSALAGEAPDDLSQWWKCGRSEIWRRSHLTPVQSRGSGREGGFQDDPHRG